MQCEPSLTEHPCSTEVTARQVIITATGNIVTPTPGIVQTENRDTILVQPPGNTPPANNQQSPQNQQQGGGSQTTQGVGGIIAGLFDPNLNTNGGNGGSGGVTAQAVPTGGATGVAAGGAAGGGAQPSGVVTGNVQSNGQSGQANGQGGSSGGLPAPLVVVIGGTQTTISPTVISNPDTTGSVTGFVLGPGSTLLVGGSPITVSGTAISAPAATSSGGIGGAIATGLGYSGPSAADSIASSIRGPNMPLWAFAAIAGVFGVLAVGL